MFSTLSRSSPSRGLDILPSAIDNTNLISSQDRSEDIILHRAKQSLNNGRGRSLARAVEKCQHNFRDGSSKRDKQGQEGEELK